MFVAIFTSKVWAPPQGIAQAVGIGHAGHDFQLLPFILGLMGHLINSVILGLIFLAIAVAFNLRGLATVLVGAIYGVVAYTIIYRVWGSTIPSRHDLGVTFRPRQVIPVCNHSGAWQQRGSGRICRGDV